MRKGCTGVEKKECRVTGKRETSGKYKKCRKSPIPVSVHKCVQPGIQAGEIRSPRVVTQLQTRLLEQLRCGGMAHATGVLRWTDTHFRKDKQERQGGGVLSL